MKFPQNVLILVVKQTQAHACNVTTVVHMRELYFIVQILSIRRHGL